MFWQIKILKQKFLNNKYVSVDKIVPLILKVELFKSDSLKYRETLYINSKCAPDRYG